MPCDKIFHRIVKTNATITQWRPHHYRNDNVRHEQTKCYRKIALLPISSCQRWNSSYPSKLEIVLSTQPY